MARNPSGQGRVCKAFECWFDSSPRLEFEDMGYNFEPSEIGFTVVGLSPDAAGTVTVNGHPATVAGNTFTATIPEAPNITAHIKAK